MRHWLALDWQEFLSYKDKSIDVVAKIRYLQENIDNWAAATALNDDIKLRTLRNFEIFRHGARLNREYLKAENRERLAGLAASFWELPAFSRAEPVVFLHASLMTGEAAPLGAGFHDCQINDSRVGYWEFGTLLDMAQRTQRVTGTSVVRKLFHACSSLKKIIAVWGGFVHTYLILTLHLINQKNYLLIPFNRMLSLGFHALNNAYRE